MQYLQYFINILIYIVLMVAVIISLKKLSIYLEKKNYMTYKDKNLKVLEKVILSKDKEILIVEVYGKKYFLGVSSTNISILKEIDVK